MNILYVENHAGFAATVRRTFLGEHEVVVVPSLALARERLEEASFDLLLVDYDLDDGKGATLVAELRRAGETVPIVAASAHDDGNDALREAGADAVCKKAHFAQLGAVLAGLGL